MFEIEGSYSFSKIGNHSKFTINRKHAEHLFKYRFKADKHIYIAEVEVYLNDIYILKFYKRSHKNRKDKFNILTREGKCSRIIGTCFSIFLDIYKSNPKASFGFIGAFTINEKSIQVEPIDNTKRYRIYTKAMLNFFGEETFTYFDNPLESFYIAVNNSNKDVYKVAEYAASVLEDLVLN